MQQKEVLPRKADRKKQKWMTDHILNLMENRKQFRNSDKDEYNTQYKQINLACNQCEEVEQLEKQYKSREMHNKVKELTSNNTKKQVDAYRTKTEIHYLTKRK